MLEGTFRGYVVHPHLKEIQVNEVTWKLQFQGNFHITVCNFKLNTQVVLAQYATNQAGFFFREACYFCTLHIATNYMTILE